MGIFMRLVDHAEDTKLHGYALFSTALVLLFLGTFLLLKKEWSIHSSTKFPIVGIESPGYLGLVKARGKFASDALHIVKSGYHKYPGKNFVVTTYSYDKVVLTHGQFKELSNAPDHTVSLQDAGRETMMGTYTGMDRLLGNNYIQDAVRTKLTQNLGTIKDAIIEEIRLALDTELAECTTDEWRSVEISTPILRTVARTSSRVFVGLPLCRNEDWLTISMNFTGDVFMTINKLTKIPKPIRPFYAWMINSKKGINSHRKKAEILLGPTIQRRLEEERLAEKNGAVYKKPNDMLQWLTDLVEPRHKTLSSLSELQLGAILVSIRTTSTFLLNALYDLAAHQECIQPIREEIEGVISANGGVIDRVALRKMRKTDSFFKESMRKNIPLFSFNRKIMKSLTLSDGTHLPKGALVATPNALFSTDPDFVEDPETFDGFRWYKKSLEAEGLAAHNASWTTTSTTNLVFGHGRHACPGRFFAAEVMKIFLTFIILQYDVKYPEGQSRPASVKYGEFSSPDTTRQLLLKKLPGPKKFSFF